MRNGRNVQNIPSDSAARLVRYRTPGPFASDESIQEHIRIAILDWAERARWAPSTFAPTPMRPTPTTRTLALILLFWSFWTGLGCTATIPTRDATPTLPADSFAGLQSECLPQFPDHNEWYGGDAAYSVPLPTGDGRTSLWLFGDSFVQRPGELRGRTYPFVHNTIGISRCDSHGRWSIETFWHRDGRGTPRAFFVPDPNAKWVRLAMQGANTVPYYWLFDGFIAHDVLFVGLLRVVPSEPRGPFNLPFRLVGMDLARIENYRDAPTEWRIQVSTLSDDTNAFPGSAFVVTATHLYAFAFFDREDGQSPRILSRLDLDALRHWQPDFSADLETLELDSQWRPGFSPDGAKVVMDDNASEMSVHFDRLSKTWMAVYSDSTRTDGVRLPTAIQIRTARTLAGPWSDPKKLISIPETEPNHVRSTDENLFCYAGKTHPQFASPGELVVTYVCNLFARNPGETLDILQRLQVDADLYRPRAISLRFPQRSNSAASAPGTSRTRPHGDP
jgi:hypothetical protein